MDADWGHSIPCCTHHPGLDSSPGSITSPSLRQQEAVKHIDIQQQFFQLYNLDLTEVDKSIIL